MLFPFHSNFAAFTSYIVAVYGVKGVKKGGNNINLDIFVISSTDLTAVICNIQR